MSSRLPIWTKHPIPRRIVQWRVSFCVGRLSVPHFLYWFAFLFCSELIVYFFFVFQFLNRRQDVCDHVSGEYCFYFDFICCIYGREKVSKHSLFAKFRRKSLTLKEPCEFFRFFPKKIYFRCDATKYWSFCVSQSFYEIYVKFVLLNISTIFTL